MSAQELSKAWTLLTARKDNNHLVSELVGAHSLGLAKASSTSSHAESGGHHATRALLVRLKVFFDHQLYYFAISKSGKPDAIIDRDLCFQTVIYILHIGTNIDLFHRSLFNTTFLSAFRLLTLNTDRFTNEEEITLRQTTGYLYQTWARQSNLSSVDLETLILGVIIPQTLNEMQHGTGQCSIKQLGCGEFQESGFVSSPFCRNPADLQARCNSIRGCRDVFTAALGNMRATDMVEAFWVLHDTSWALVDASIRGYSDSKGDTGLAQIVTAAVQLMDTVQSQALAISSSPDPHNLISLRNFFSDNVAHLSRATELLFPLSVAATHTAKQGIASEVVDFEQFLRVRDSALSSHCSLKNTSSLVKQEFIVPPPHMSFNQRAERIFRERPISEERQEMSPEQLVYWGASKQFSTAGSSLYLGAQPSGLKAADTSSLGSFRTAGERLDLVSASRSESPPSPTTQSQASTNGNRISFSPSSEYSQHSEWAWSQRGSISTQLPLHPSHYMSPDDSSSTVGYVTHKHNQPQLANASLSPVSPTRTRFPNPPQPPRTPRADELPFDHRLSHTPTEASSASNSSEHSKFSLRRAKMFQGFTFRKPSSASERSATAPVTAAPLQPAVRTPVDLCFSFSAISTSLLLWEPANPGYIIKLRSPFEDGTKLLLRRHTTVPSTQSGSGESGITVELVEGGEQIVAAVIFEDPYWKLVCFDGQGTPHGVYLPPSLSPIALAVSRDDSKVAVGCGRTVLFYGINDGVPVTLKQLPAHSKLQATEPGTHRAQRLQKLNFSIDSKTLIAATQEPTSKTREHQGHQVHIRLWNLFADDTPAPPSVQEASSAALYTAIPSTSLPPPPAPPTHQTDLPESIPLNLGYGGTGLSGIFATPERLFLTARAAKSYSSVLPLPHAAPPGTYPTRLDLADTSIDGGAQAGRTFVFRNGRHDVCAMMDVRSGRAERVVSFEGERKGLGVKREAMAVGLEGEGGGVLVFWRGRAGELVLKRVELGADGRMVGEAKEVRLEVVYDRVVRGDTE
ncbi:hypothetical protein B0H67DRAFT_553957 [Lasiosphaeris hirsuta]|uniref:Uncharacterized protein n=1 Tax=Lasiosphaeris hirsuta TaxID=260670 RepID=A0AA40AGJ0_9PEZI|nr:hypothetical protein B0H67DRAFT_553957 [Lasiosphaeris hirsuta]